MVEVDSLSALRRSVTREQVSDKITQFREFFDIDQHCSLEELQRAAATSVALDGLVTDRAIDMMAYYYMGSGIAENENTMSSIILGTSLLTGSGIPVAGEYEVKNVLAMKILDEFGAGGSFTEFYALDFKEDLVLMGHDGPGHPGIAENKIRVRPLKVYHGKVGDGLSVEMAVKHGPVTLLSIVEDKDAGFSFLVAEGESVAGPVLEIGNTNSRYRFSPGVRAFVETSNASGPAHHCAVAVGHWGRQLERIAELMGLGFKQIC
jgi:L-arabinose isomerase